MYYLLFACLLSSFCGWMVPFLVPLCIHQITGSEVYTATSYGLGFVPYLLFLPLSGALADIFNKKRMMQVLELLNLLFSVGLMVAIFIYADPRLILLAHFCLCSIAAIQHPVFQGMIPAVVPSEKAKYFHAYTSLADRVISLVAPLLTGLFLTMGTAEMLCYSLSAGYALAFVFVSLIAYPAQHTGQWQGIGALFSSLKEAARYIAGEKFFRATIALFFFACFSNTFITSNLLHYLTHYHGVPHEAVSYYMLPTAVGAIVGALLAPYLIGAYAGAKVILYAILLDLVARWLMLTTHNLYGLLGLWAVNSLTTSIVVVSYFTLRQKIVPPHLLSRTVALTRMLAWVAVPPASIASSLLFAKTQSFHHLVLASSLILFIGLLLCWRMLSSAQPAYKQNPKPL